MEIDSLVMSFLVNDAHRFQMLLPGCCPLQSRISWRNLCAWSFAVDVGTGYRYIFGNISFPCKWRESKKKNGVGLPLNSSWCHEDDASLSLVFRERWALVIVIVSHRERATGSFRNARCLFLGISFVRISYGIFIWKITFSVWISLNFQC